MLPPEPPIYALPSVCYGKSNEHIGFPGTMAISATTYMAVLHDIGASVAAAGFKKLVCITRTAGLVAERCDGARPARGVRTAAFHMSAAPARRPRG